MAAVVSIRRLRNSRFIVKSFIDFSSLLGLQRQKFTIDQFPDTNLLCKFPVCHPMSKSSVFRQGKTIGVASMQKQKIAFILAASDHGSMILNRLDLQTREDGLPFGVGGEILTYGAFEASARPRLGNLLEARRKRHGDGVVVVDCGANIGALTIGWAKMMRGWGSVIAIEAQERIFYALAGNVALNNCFNARVLNVAVGAENTIIEFEEPDYTMPANFGGLELRPSPGANWIGQDLNQDGRSTRIQCITLNSLNLPRVDLIKIDVEGMEMDVLQGATQYLAMRPIFYVEHSQVGQDRLGLISSSWATTCSRNA